MASTKKSADMDETFGDEDTDLSRFDQTPIGNKAAYSQREIQALLDAEDPLEALAALAADKGTEIKDAALVMGDGTVVVDKEALINKPFVIFDWRHCEGTQGIFSAVKALDPTVGAGQPGRVFVFTDGGTGIHERLVNTFLKEGRTVPISCPHGLTVSEYETDGFDSVTGKPAKITGRTFYVANKGSN